MTHDRATPVGGSVRAAAEVTAVEGRRIIFTVKAFDGKVAPLPLLPQTAPSPAQAAEQARQSAPHGPAAKLPGCRGSSQPRPQPLSAHANFDALDPASAQPLGNCSGGAPLVRQTPSVPP